MKKFFFLALALITVSSLTAQNIKGDLRVWSFTDEVKLMVNKYLPVHKELQILYSQYPSDQYQNRLDPVLASGMGLPDVFVLDSTCIRKYVESGQLLDLTSIYEKNKSKLLAFPVEVGTYNGRVYAMSWNACPGAMFYRRSLARKYLGTDDPAKVQEYFSNFNKFLETANVLKEKSGGKCVVVAGVQDLYKPLLGARAKPWVVNGKIEIDPVMEQYMDFCKTLSNNGLEGGVDSWSQNWFNAMKDAYQKEVFSYFMPTWGFHYVLKTNAPNTARDWAMIQGPAPYFWGGTWLAANKNTKDPQAALAMIEWITTNDGFLEQWAKDTRDLVGNTTVINKIKNTYSEPFLAGQNHYAAFADMAKNVNGKLAQKTDDAIEELFWKRVGEYSKGTKTKVQVLADFGNQAQAAIAPKPQTNNSPQQAQANNQQEVQSDDDFEVKQNADNTLTITGYKWKAKDLVIPATLYGLKVTIIGNNAFRSKEFRSIVIPDTVITIENGVGVGGGAFAYNKELTKVTLGNGLKNIGDYAFFQSSNLTEIVIPNSVTRIGNGAFQWAGRRDSDSDERTKEVFKVTFGTGLQTIEGYAFANNEIAELNLPSSLKEIGVAAFYNNKIQKVTFSTGLQFIGNAAFRGNQITELNNLPSSLKTIGGGAFANNQIQSLTIPNGVTKISSSIMGAPGYTNVNYNEGAFVGNPITTLIIPASLANGGFYGAFSSFRYENISRRITTITRITIPTGMNEKALEDSFEEALVNFWISQNRAGGTYVKKGPIWTKQ